MAVCYTIPGRMMSLFDGLSNRGVLFIGINVRILLKAFNIYKNVKCFRDSSRKPKAWIGFAGRKGEDLQRIARAAGNAIIQLAILSRKLAVIEEKKF
jgi:hypothetical protein